MVAQDVMITDIRSVPATATIAEALAIMRQHDVTHLVVVEEGRLLGILSASDYQRLVDIGDPDGAVCDLMNVEVRKIMTPADSLVTAKPDTPLMNIAQLMVLKTVRCVPVLDHAFGLAGVVIDRDVMRELTRSRLAEPLARHRERHRASRRR